jgi:hypothetical protein
MVRLRKEFLTGGENPSRKEKSEIRTSKSETNSNFEEENSNQSCFGFRIKDFGFVSDFEIRISNLAIELQLGETTHYGGTKTRGVGH